MKTIKFQELTVEEALNINGGQMDPPFSDNSPLKFIPVVIGLIVSLF